MAEEERSLEKYFYWFAILVFIALISVGAYIYIDNSGDDEKEVIEEVKGDDDSSEENVTGEGEGFVEEVDTSNNEVETFNLNNNTTTTTGSGTDTTQSDADGAVDNVPGRIFVDANSESRYVDSEIDNIVASAYVSAPTILEYSQSDRYSNVSSLDVKVSAPSGLDERILSLLSYQYEFCEYDISGLCGAWIEDDTRYGYLSFGSNVLKNGECGVECERWSNMISKADSHTIQITGLKFDTRYNVRVRALVDSKKSDWVQMDRLITRHSPVDGVTLSRDDDDNYIINWNPVNNEYVDGYFITYCIRNECEATETSFVVEGRETNRNMLGVLQVDVQENQHYVASVIVNIKDTELDSIRSEPVSFITASFNPVVNGNILTFDEVPPLNIYADYNVNEEGTYIPSLYRTEYDVRYLFNYCSTGTGCGDDSGEWEALPIFNNSVSLANLSENTNYDIRMLAVGYDEFDSPVDIGDLRTGNFDSSLWNKYSISVGYSSDNRSEDVKKQMIEVDRTNPDGIYFNTNFQVHDISDISYCEYDESDNCNNVDKPALKADAGSTELYKAKANYSVGNNSFSLLQPDSQYALMDLKRNTEYKISVNKDGEIYELDRVLTDKYPYLSYANEGPVKIEHNVREGDVLLKMTWNFENSNEVEGFEIVDGDVIGLSLCQQATEDPALDKVYYCNSFQTQQIQEYPIDIQKSVGDDGFTTQEYSVSIPYPKSESIVDYISTLQLRRGEFAPTILLNSITSGGIL